MPTYCMTPDRSDTKTSGNGFYSREDFLEILRYADEGTRDEAQALTMITIMADGDLSDKELGALKLMSDLCRFKEMTVEEAHRILGF